MKTSTTEPLKDLKFASAEIYPYSCDIKGEPVANISSDEVNFGIIFPKKVTPAQAEEYALRIVKAVNMHEELIARVKTLHNALKQSSDGYFETQAYAETVLFLNQSSQK